MNNVVAAMPELHELAAAVIAEHASTPGGLLPALHALQHAHGWIEPAWIGPLATAFNLSVAEVHGVVSFYKDFRTEAPTGPIVQVCRAEACTARGGDAVHARLRTVADARGLEVEEVFCLGNCALGPTLAVRGDLVARVTVDDLDAVAAKALAPAAAPAPAAPATGADVGLVTVYVPGDAVACAAGADAVAAALGAQPGVQVVRNGSRGLLWLEPLVEVVTAAGRVAYGPLGPDDVAGAIAAGMLHGADHPTRLGSIDDHPWLRSQRRLTFGRVGVIDPASAAEHEAHGGLVALRRALTMQPADIVAEVVASGLRGRGGAAFPAGIKWQTVHDAPGVTKYVVVNADEGDSGTFADRMLLEGDPMLLLEGMVVAGLAVGAAEGYVYVRSEYPHAARALTRAVAAAEAAGWLGPDVLGSGRPFRVHVRVGAGAYICGEETALLESLEGRRGVVRAKPPLPAHHGLFGRPTLVHNVLTLAAVPSVLADGPAAYAALGVGRSLGTQVFQLAGNVARGGIVEVPFGVTVRELVEQYGGGTASGRPVRAVQIGGPLGAYLPASQLDLAADYETFAEAHALLGHGGIVVFDDTVDMVAQARFAFSFCAAESCGKCTPCRIGAVRGVELVDKIRDGVAVTANLALLDELCEVMADASLCAMGGLTPMPVRSALRHFADDFLRPEGSPS